MRLPGGAAGAIPQGRGIAWLIYLKLIHTLVPPGYARGLLWAAFQHLIHRVG